MIKKNEECRIDENNVFACDYFTLFDLPITTNINAETLRERYQCLQMVAHPDRFVGMAESDKSSALRISGRINDAYNTLKNPLQCADYLLSLHGVIVFGEENTAMSGEFLMQQLEWREALAVADDAERAKLLQDITETREAVMKSTEDALQQKDFALAADNVRQWKYLEKILSSEA